MRGKIIMNTVQLLPQVYNRTGRMKDLRITLVQDRPDQPFYSGSSVTGSLLVDVDEPKSYKHISIQFLGSAYVHWTETRSEGSGDNRRTRTVHYSSSVVYVDVAQTVWTADQSLDGRLPPGQHSFPFQFGIPPTAPSSFEGTVGSIRYALHGRIGTGLLKFDHRIEVRIPVQQVVRVSDPRLLQSVCQEVQKTVCCLCCASAPIVLTVTVPKTGCCIGETLPVHVSIENGSSRCITLTASLCQGIVYTAQGHHRYSRKTLVGIGSDEIAPQVTRDWDPMLQVPATEVLDEQSCSIIQVSYSLNVTAVIPRALNLSTAIPLKLGNVPEQSPLGGSTLPPQPPPQVQPLPQVQPPPYPYDKPALYQPPPVVPSQPAPIGWNP